MSIDPGARGLGARALVLAGISPGPGVVFMGDSITARDDAYSSGIRADSYADYAHLASNGGFYVVWNSGIGGNTTAQMLARFQTDVIAYKPNCVAILAGTNDTTPATQTLPNVKAMIKAALAAGIAPILATIPPAGSAAISPPTVTATPSTTGGTLATATYAYRVSAVNGVGETLASTEVTAAVTGPTGSVALTWPSVQGATGYKIYGRTTGAELFIAYNNNTGGQSRPSPTYTDTGSVTPSGALPGSNTTAATLSTAVRTKIQQVNAIVVALGQAYGIPVVDFYGYLVDSTTGMYQTGWTTDGTHPTEKASKLMGVFWWNALKNYFRPWVPYISKDNADATVLYTNPLFTSNNGSNPTSWGPFGGSGAAESMGTDVAVAGSVLTITRTDYTQRFNQSPNLTGWSVGDVLSFSGWMKATGMDANGSQAAVSLKSTGGSSSYVASIIINSDTPSGTWAPFYCEGTVSAGTTSIAITTGVGYAPVTLSIAQITVRNLTVLGLRPFVY